jgi:uroporphyrinogen III methyltransferase/synthase
VSDDSFVDEVRPRSRVQRGKVCSVPVQEARIVALPAGGLKHRRSILGPADADAAANRPPPHGLPDMHLTQSKPIGRVIFVGAGPGQPDLLTIRAADCLRHADVVVHDALVPAYVLDILPPAVERIPVPRDTADQHDPGEAIGHLLAGLAAGGRTVVRLKGGDPSVFARLAEELQPLRDGGIPVEIVPGVTAVLAAAAAAGVPLTSRSAASSLTILTGHEADEKAAGVDFQTLAGLPGTLAIYMGVEQADKWSRSLLAAGKPADTPVTIVSRCSWPDQTVAVTSLGRCAADFQQHRWPAPAVIIVGEVAQATAGPSRAVRPLAGRRVLLTRPAGQGEELASLIRSQGGECVHLPLIRIDPPPTWEPLDAAIRTADTFDWIVFASVNGVRSFSDRLRAAGRDARALGTARLAAIGPATREELERSGFACDLTPDLYRSEGLAEALGRSVRRGRFLVVRADRGRDVLRREWEEQGHHVAEVVAYSSRIADAPDAAALQSLDRLGIDWVTVTSSLIAEAAARLLGERLRAWRIASISPVTSATLEQLGFAPTVEAGQASGDSLVDAMTRWEIAHAEKSPRRA